MGDIAILDIVLAAVLLFAVIIGAARGLYRSIAGVLVLVLALWGALWCAAVSAPPVAELLRPRVEQSVAERVRTAVEQERETPAADDAFEKAEKLLRRFGWQGDLQKTVEERTQSVLTTAETAITAAIVESFLTDFVTLALKILFFLVLFVALLLLSRLLTPVFEKLPVLRGFNRLGGGIAGLLLGCIILYIVLAIVHRSGAVANAESSILYRFYLHL